MVLARVMMANTTARLEAGAASFSCRSACIAEGVAQEWLWLAARPKQSIDALLQPQTWQIENYSVSIFPSSCQNKIHIQKVPLDDWRSFTETLTPGTSVLTTDLAGRLQQTSYAGLEVLWDESMASSRYVYLGHVNQPPPADSLTVWGDGSVDLNRAPREVLQVRLKGLTDAQLSALVVLREKSPIASYRGLGDLLNLSPKQVEELQHLTVLQPQWLELIIRINHGPSTSVHHAVLSLGNRREILELRAVE
jgi:hypothetical protein